MSDVHKKKKYLADHIMMDLSIIGVNAICHPDQFLCVLFTDWTREGFFLANCSCMNMNCMIDDVILDMPISK